MPTLPHANTPSLANGPSTHSRTLSHSMQCIALRAYFDRGASFGLGAIVSQVSDGAFGDQLGRIVPRLFRYRFDPSAKTRSAMEQLWRSVVGGGAGGGDFSSREKEVRVCVWLCVWFCVCGCVCALVFQVLNTLDPPPLFEGVMGWDPGRVNCIVLGLSGAVAAATPPVRCALVG